MKNPVTINISSNLQHFKSKETDESSYRQPNLGRFSTAVYEPFL